MMNVKYWNYGQYSSDNYGAHTMAFCDAEGNRYWFSYSTLVAFQKTGHERVVSENVWGPTTGKHLNWIDGGNKKNRVSREEFLERYNDYFAA